MSLSPIYATDFYKLSHIDQYPPNTQYIYSNFTCRSAKLFPGLPDFDNKVVFFGLQGFLENYLVKTWNREFFDKPFDFSEQFKYKRFVHEALGIPTHKVRVQHLIDLHELGYLPIEIKSLPEGSRVNIKVPLFTIMYPG